MKFLFPLVASACLLSGCNRSEVTASVRLAIPQSAATRYLSKYKTNDPSRNKVDILGVQWTISRFNIDTRVDPSDVGMQLTAEGADARAWPKTRKPANFTDEVSRTLGKFLEADGQVTPKLYRFPGA